MPYVGRLSRDLQRLFGLPSAFRDEHGAVHGAYSSHMSDPREVLTRAAPSGEIVPYGPHPDQVLEMFEPSRETGRTIVFVHGGFWRQAYDRSHVRPLCNDLADRGHRVVSVEYRRTGGDGGWPATFEDVGAALAHVTADIDTPVILAGHSAGGQLCLYAAVDSTTVAAVVALAPVSDLTRAYSERLDGDAVAAVMGGDPHSHADRYAAVDPMLRPPRVPVTVLHGDRDRQVPVEYSRSYADAHDANLVELAGAGHFELIDPRSRAWQWVYHAMRRER